MGLVFLVHQGDLDLCLRVMKKSLQREHTPNGRRRTYEKPSAKRRRKKAEAKRSRAKG